MSFQRMRTEWQAFSVEAQASLKDTMMAIGQGRLGIALVLDADKHLVGTVTDGDVRRAFLKGCTIDTPVDQVMNPKFSAVRQGTSDADILQMMRRLSVKQVPVLDANGTLLGLYSMADFIEPSKHSNWVVIMAGGEGRRLRPLTENTPKPMLNVRDKPLLEGTVRLLVDHGFHNIFIAINYLGEQIEEHFGRGEAFGCSIAYLREEQALGTAGALGLLPEIPAESILVLNGDLLTDLDFSALVEYHESMDCVATQCVREYVNQVPFGVVKCEKGYVVGMEEKPVQRLLVNAGIYVIAPQLLSHLNPDTPSTMPDLLTKALEQGDKVAGFPIHERWTDIGHIEDYRWARDNWSFNEEQ